MSQSVWSTCLRASVSGLIGRPYMCVSKVPMRVQERLLSALPDRAAQAAAAQQHLPRGPCICPDLHLRGPLRRSDCMGRQLDRRRRPPGECAACLRAVAAAPAAGAQDSAAGAWR